MIASPAVSSPPEDRTRTVASAPVDRALLRGYRLEVIAGPDRGAVHEASDARTVVGTHESAGFVLGDPTVSRFHCEIETTDRGLRVRDLDSRNRTRLDGADVAEIYLTRPATLVLGDTRLLVAAAAEVRLSVPLSGAESFGTMRGRSRSMRAVFATLEKAAATDATVLLTGETGVGKDLAASGIHAESARRDGPFVVVDCGAVPRDLLESELFGHVRGAFTGAHADRRGAFESANGGTLFLDEIGELDTTLQPKLLRALESRTVKRVGATDAVPIDVRIVAATNRALPNEVNQKRFRSDLYYRLAVITIAIPPLRDRTDDIPVLVDAILAASALEGHPLAVELRAQPTLDRLAHYAWPGNVRELRNYVERYLALGSDDAGVPAIGQAPEHAGAPTIDATQRYRAARKHWLDTFERAYLRQLLADHGDNVTAAARTAGVDRVHLHRLLSRAGLR